MSSEKPTYIELEQKRAESEGLVEALRMHEIDAIIGEDNVAVVRLREVEEQLIEAKRTAEQRADDLEAFSYSVSHDLRNPLNSISANTKLLYMEIKPEPGTEADKALKHISQSVYRMAQVITDLLILSGIARRKIKYERVNLSEMVETFLSELRATSPHRSVEVHVQPDVAVDADSGLLRILLENLIRNAWKFTSKNLYARIEFGTMYKEDAQAFFIKDNGVGFDMTLVNKMFNAFERFHPESEYPGTGIGLAIVKSVIEKHRGKIWAESEPGKGATFLFSIA